MYLGKLPSGMPSVQFPPFGFTKEDNTTVSFIEMCTNLGSGLFVLPLIALMEDVAICKAFSKFPFRNIILFIVVWFTL